MFVLDHETFGPNEKKTIPVLGDAVVDTDGVGSELIELQEGVGGEIRVELKLSVSADSNQIAHINGEAKLFEGDDEGTQDLEDTKTIIKQVLPNQTRDIEVNLVNSGFGGGDKADIKLTFTNAPANINLSSGSVLIGALPRQDQWRWCHRCSGMWFAGGGDAGRCPQGGGHVQDGSGNYGLVDGIAYPAGQPLWRWCQKCMGLWFSGAGFGQFGRCPAGGGHSKDGSGNYILTEASNAPGQRGWRWCNKCMGLWFFGAGSRCPLDGNAHSPVGSGDYVIAVN
jgi:hypothetical protein